MQTYSNFSLQSLNTFHIKARAVHYIRFTREKEIIEFLQKDLIGQRPSLVIGRGSNLLFVGDFDGFVLHPMLSGIHVVKKDRHTVQIRAMAGENWDDVVAFTVANGWGGIENLSLIPGSVGASVVQNIGAYGVEVKNVVHSVEVIAVKDGEPTVFFSDECGFGYRTSNFKRALTGQFLITAVTFTLRRRPQFVLDYSGIKSVVAAMGDVSLETIRNAIIHIRKNKLPDPNQIGNAGSFFKNPIVDSTTLQGLLRLFPGLPHYSQKNRRYKLAAGWMIEYCGFKGKRIGRVAVHEHQALVLVNLGSATGLEILELSEQIEKAVNDTFGIKLEREVQVVQESNGNLYTEICSSNA